MKLPKVYLVVGRGLGYRLEEEDFSDVADEFESVEEFEEWVLSQTHPYCLEDMPYQFVLRHGTQNFYYYDEESLRNEWEDDFIDRLMRDGSFYDEEIDTGFELYRIEPPKDK